MFDVKSVMNPAFVPFTEAADDFKTQREAGGELREMNWADPFRPDDTVPAHVKRVVVESLNTNAAHYTFPLGDQTLREKVAARINARYKMNYDATRNVTISGGSDNLFAFSLYPFLTPGMENEVMTPCPSYSHNLLVPSLIGGKTVPVPTRAEDGFQLRIEEFEARVTDKTRAVMIVSPNNPTGTVYSNESLQSLCDFVVRHDLILIVDQAFEDTVFVPQTFLCPAAFPGMKERTVLFGSLSKGMALCGFRVAYIIAPDVISRVYQSTSVFFLGAPNTMAQAGAVAALEDSAFVEEYRQEYVFRAEKLAEIIRQIPHVHFVMPESGFFFWLDISHYGTDQEVSDYLVREANVLVSTGSMCGDPNYIRIIYGALKDRDKCIDAFYRIRDAFLRHPRA